MKKIVAPYWTLPFQNLMQCSRNKRRVTSIKLLKFPATSYSFLYVFRNQIFVFSGAGALSAPFLNVCTFSTVIVHQQFFFRIEAVKLQGN